MLHFNELRVTQDNGYLIIDVSIDDGTYYEKAYIRNIYLDTQETYRIGTPSEFAVQHPLYSFTEEDYVGDNTDVEEVMPISNYSLNIEDVTPTLPDPEIIPDNQSRHVRLVLSPTDLQLLGYSKDILVRKLMFVYVVADGYSPETPCGMDNAQLMGTVTNIYPFYLEAMSHIKCMKESCRAPKEFIDTMLRFKALELSIKTGNYIKAIDYWEQFFAHKHTPTIIHNCNCNGRIL